LVLLLLDFSEVFLLKFEELGKTSGSWQLFGDHNRGKCALLEFLKQILGFLLLDLLFVLCRVLVQLIKSTADCAGFLALISTPAFKLVGEFLISIFRIYILFVLALTLLGNYCGPQKLRFFHYVCVVPKTPASRRLLETTGTLLGKTRRRHLNEL
jgi:hypothetical protein